MLPLVLSVTAGTQAAAKTLKDGFDVKKTNCPRSEPTAISASHQVLPITVLNTTKRVDGVETRVVEERESWKVS